MSRWLRVRTRLDRLAALALLTAVAPILGVAAALVRRDGGPAFVRVPRVGRGGRTFGMWKVRTMRVGSAGGLAAGSSIAVGDDDPRVTPIGRRLRRWRVDELANLVNVLRGEMALLGPRPEAVDWVDVDAPAWRVVLEAPPGIAGPTQVLVESWEARRLAEGGPTAYRDILPVKLAIDEWYVSHASPRVDLAVLRGLIGWVGARDGGAHRLRALASRDLGPILDELVAG